MDIFPVFTTSIFIFFSLSLFLIIFNDRTISSLISSMPISCCYQKYEERGPKKKKKTTLVDERRSMKDRRRKNYLLFRRESGKHSVILFVGVQR